MTDPATAVPLHPDLDPTLFGPAAARDDRFTVVDRWVDCAHFDDGDPEKNYAKRGLVANRELVRPVQLFEANSAHASVVFDICLKRLNHNGRSCHHGGRGSPRSRLYARGQVDRRRLRR